jgi:hypothetical protein
MQNGINLAIQTQGGLAVFDKDSSLLSCSKLLINSSFADLEMMPYCTIGIPTKPRVQVIGSP